MSQNGHSAETYKGWFQRRRRSTTPPDPSLSRASTNKPLSRKTTRQSSLFPAGNGLQRMQRVLTLNFKPERPVGKAPGFFASARTIIFSSWLNLLLLCIPVSWALHFVWQKNTTSTQDTIIFVFSFLAIIPLAKLLAFATDELSLRVGQTLAGLLNATLGNAVELIVSIIALIKCELQIVQSSLVGSILSNLLLVLGMCFFAGGVRFSEQGFGISAVQVQSSLLILSVVAVLLPAAFHFVAGDDIVDTLEGPDILSVSHGVAIILLVVYISYLVFQLFSHTHLYDEEHSSQNKIQSTRYPKKPSKETMKGEPDLEKGTSSAVNAPDSVAVGSSTTTANGQANGAIPNGDTPLAGAATVDTDHTRVDGASPEHVEEEDEHEEPQMSLQSAIIFLIITTVIVAVTAEFLVSSIDGLTDTGGISKEFVGMILLPIVGNAAEHVTAVTVSVRDKLDLSLGVAVGSSIQIALFVIPFIVTLAWIIGKPLTLLFDPFESIVLFLSVIVVNYTVQDGKSNWLEGAILMCLYVILAVVFWYYPGTNVAHNFLLPGCPNQ